MKLTFAAFNCLKVFQTVKLIVLNQKKLKHQRLRFAQIFDSYHSCKELKKVVKPGDEKVMGEVANQHAEVVGVIERQSAKVENAEEDVSGHGGDFLKTKSKKQGVKLDENSKCI